MKNYFRSYGVVVALTALLSPLTRADTLSENQARFGVVTGQVTVLPSGAAEWVEAHDGMPIETGDHIRVADESQAEFIVSQNAMWILEADTDIIPERMDQQSGRFNIPSGSLLGKVDSARAAQAQHWDFNTPAAVCGVRGTEFAIEASHAKGTSLAVFEGQVEFAPAEGPGGQPEPVRVGPNQQFVAEPGHLAHRLARFSPAMNERLRQRADLRTRLQRVQNTWSPDSVEIRKGVRANFVKATNRLPKVRTLPRRRLRRGKP